MKSTDTALAIVGVGCRLPGGVNSLDDLWTLLMEQRDAVTAIPENRFDLQRFIHPDRKAPGRGCTSSAGIIDTIYEFDADFFGISRKEAESMDPQQRLVLEMTWEAFEDAGIAPSSMAGSRTAVFIGAASTDAGICRADDPYVMNPYSMTGTSLGIIANRVSYLFDFHGPSMTVDTACSSSMVALHQACQAILDNELPLAIAGGVNVLLSPYPFIGFSKAHMLSKDGRCKVFDASGNGYVRAEGGGILLIKRFSDAITDGNRIHALIRATDVNSDGRTTGIALPNAEAQKTLLRSIYAQKSLDPSRVMYVEAHGTGTAAGDPIEASAIGAVLGQARPASDPLYVGSVKSNLGHLETGSGMAGLLKALGVLRHRTIPANLHLDTPNPAIDLHALNLRMPISPVSFPDTSQSPLVGVNSFGFGGTNAHVVLEGVEKSLLAGQPCQGAHSPLLLSARSTSALVELARQYARLLAAPHNELYDLAASAYLHREHLESRLLVTAEKAEDAASALLRFAESGQVSQEDTTLLYRGEVACTTGLRIFAFSGNGCQWAGMGAGLLDVDQEFTRVMSDVDACLEPLQGWSLRELMRRPFAEWGLEHTEIAQPLLFAVQVALAETLMVRGVIPDMVYGHSVGEVAAAYVSGALDLRDACTVIHHRSRLQETTHGSGGMAAVNVSPVRAMELIAAAGGGVELAAVNAPASVTLAGDTATLQRIGELVQAEKGFFKLLPLAYPFHSSAMDVLQQPLLSALASIAPRDTAIRFVSTVTGTELNGKALNADYWWRNIRCPVQFAPATQALLDAGGRIFLELGAHGILQYYIKDAIRTAEVRACVRSTLKRDADDVVMLHTAWREICTSGWLLDRKTLFPTPYQRVSLPRYPWEREYLWPAATREGAGFIASRQVHPLLGWRVADGVQVYENTIDTQLYPWLNGHTVGETVLFPAAGFIELCHAAARLREPDAQVIEIVNLDLRRPLVLNAAPAKKLRVSVGGTGEVHLASRTVMATEEWLTHGKCRLRGSDQVPPASVALRTSHLVALPVDSLYATARELGFQYAPPFRPIVAAWKDGADVLAEFSLTDTAAGQGMLLAPPLVDGALQLLFLLLAEQHVRHKRTTYLPSWFGQMIFYGSGAIRYARARFQAASVRSVVASFELYDETGAVLAQLRDCRFRRAELRSGGASQSLGTFRSVFQPSPHPSLPAVSSLPSPSELVAFLEPLMDALAGRHERGMYFDTVLPLCQAATIALAHEVAKPLAQVGGFTLEEGVRLGYAKPEFVPYLVFILELLVSQGLASHENGIWQIKAVSGLPPSIDLWRTIVADYPAHLPEAILVGRVGLHLRALVRGEMSPAQLLGLEQVGTIEHFYANAPSVRLINESVTMLVRDLTERCPQGQRLRILEVGAAPGGLLSCVVTALDARKCEYTVSDKDAKAVERLEAMWGEKDSLAFAVLDMEAIAQHSGGYDLILAGQALHAADSVENALRGCLALLAPGGVLVCLERAPSELQNMIQGADPWWWNRSVTPQEPASRLLGPESWKKVLQRAGFVDVRLVHEPCDHAGPDSFLVLGAKPAAHRSDTILPTPETEGTWVILADDWGRGSWGDSLCPWLECPGMSVLRVMHGGILKAPDSDMTLCNPESPESWRDLYRSLAGKGRIECVHLLGMDTRSDCETSDLEAVSLKRLRAATAMTQGWELAGRPPCRLWLVTGGCQVVDGEDGAVVMSQAPLWGFGRVLQNEMPALDTRLLDLHGAANDVETVLALAREILAPGEDRELVLYRSRRYAGRVEAFDANPTKRGAGDVADAIRLVFDTPGRLERLYWRQVSRQLPGAGEVQIQTMATGLNFRDVMWAMGMLPDEALENGFSGPTMGLECSGIITAVGPGVRECQVGDEVVCFAPNCFSSFVITSVNAVAPKPSALTFEEAATVPVAFFTAYYALKHLAQSVEGERVLIHGAAGGVGLAAIQVAHHLGLEIFATAGSEEKRDFLRLLGVDHVLDSRSLRFAEDILTLTGGEGVDMVLNSLHGEAIEKGLSALRPFGRFLELGKRDFYGDTPMFLRPFRNNISYFGIDVDQLLTARPKMAQELFTELMALFEQRVLRPLPHRIFPRANAADAFRIMQQARHIGKLVVTFDDHVRNVRPASMIKPVLPVSGDATYLITGGLGGFGLQAAERLIERGARHLVLLGRTGAERPEAARAVDSFRAKGVDVQVIAVDVSDRVALKDATSAGMAHMPPCRGIIHAAGILDDAVILNQTPERLARVWRVKALGAWNLHCCSKDCDLDFFIMFSSATTMLGNPGQSNYVAANCALESLAEYRRRLGQPALAIGWGPIGDVGMLARDGKALDSLKNILGVVPVQSKDALDLMEQLHWQAVTSPAVFQIDWRKIRHLPAAASKRFAGVRGHQGQDAGSGESLLDEIQGKSREDGVTILAKCIAEEAATIMRIPAARIDLTVPVAELGMDSLMAVELGIALEERLGVEAPSISLAGDASIVVLAERFFEVICGGAQVDTLQQMEYTMQMQHGTTLIPDVLDKVREEVLLVETEHD